MNRTSAPTTRIVLMLAALLAGLLGAGLLAGDNGTQIARGTSEAIGYPTNTPAPPPPPPPDTATSVPVLPTATTAPVPPTATTAPPTATAIPPTSSATRVPSTAIPSSTPTSTHTATATRTATATPTATPRPVALSIHLSSPVAAAGDTLILQVRTLPGLAVKAVVRYPSLNRQVVVTGKAGQKGVGQLTLLLTEKPQKGRTSLAAVITVTVSDRTHRATASSSITVYPALGFAVAAKLEKRGGSRQVAVSVSLARAATINVRLLLTGKGQRPINARGQATRAGTVVLLIPVPPHHGRVSANLRITVRTREGVTETRGLSIPLGS